MIRLFVSEDLVEGAELRPSPEQAHYLQKVMRLSRGDAVTLFNGRDGEWRAAISVSERRDCRLRVETRTRPQTFGPDVDLVIALIKRGPLETAVEKAVELGVRRVRLARTDRTNSDHVNLGRLRAIVLEACEQCQRLDPPEVFAPEPLGAVMDQALSGGRGIIVCDESRAGPLIPELEPGDAAGWTLVIGPEGGFSPGEHADFRARAGVARISLGPRILRAETAAMAALTLWQSRFGDWRGLEIGGQAGHLNP